MSAGSNACSIVPSPINTILIQSDSFILSFLEPCLRLVRLSPTLPVSLSVCLSFFFISLSVCSLSLVHSLSRRYSSAQALFALFPSLIFSHFLSWTLSSLTHSLLRLHPYTNTTPTPTLTLTLTHTHTHTHTHTLPFFLNHHILFLFTFQLSSTCSSLLSQPTLLLSHLHRSVRLKASGSFLHSTSLPHRTPYNLTLLTRSPFQQFPLHFFSCPYCSTSSQNQQTLIQQTQSIGQNNASIGD